ncbi:hypothetical protein EG329_002896 [Mollisiaceae sp. DMI_Dod_QoI]|nr:hypothetical protein EG329_002896 [Helotiales sp. DMI_Dod_QoI]
MDDTDNSHGPNFGLHVLGNTNDDGSFGKIKDTISRDKSEAKDILATMHTTEDLEESDKLNFKHVPDESSDDKEYGTPLKLRRNIQIGEDETLDDCVTPAKAEIVTKTTNGTLSSEVDDFPVEDDQGSQQISGSHRGPVAAFASAKTHAVLSPDLYNNSPSSQLFQFLLDVIQKLEVQKEALESQLSSARQSVGAVVSAPNPNHENADYGNTDKSPIYEEFHLVWHGEHKQYFRDVPRKFEGDLRSDLLRGRQEVENGTKYLKDHQQTAFIVIREYDGNSYLSANHYSSAGSKGGKLIQDAPLAESYQQNISTSPKIQQALRAMIDKHSESFSGFCTDDFPKYFLEPYLFFYLKNKVILGLLDSSGLDEDSCRYMKLLCGWFEDNCRADWDEADELLSRGKINAKHYRKLFRPDEIILTKLDDGILHARKTEPYPWRDEKDRVIDIFQWTFNGSFTKDKLTLGLRKSDIDLIFDEKDGEKDITSLQIYPLRFADDGLQQKLSARGEKFWTCRKKKLVCYRETDYMDPADAERRVMIDYQIFRRMHGSKAIFLSQQDDLGAAAMDAHEPPEGDFLALLPPYIHGFNLHTKSWIRIRVDRITDVTWNKDAFKRLVVPAETKELIQALVTAQISQVHTAPDIIAGKGNGLIILLHGGPGTGKTLTAESIAELEERPLYRVTCGDIGMEPEDVERERSLADLKRNALISVFLRVLEYYNGILVLTTNRVGTFDEAFKSRIQLALRYPNLDQEQRQEIWSNFFYMLRRTKEKVDIDDLEMNIGHLAAIEINGRQIRNVVTTARHLAKFRKERLVYRHVQHAIATVTKFDEYLLEVKGISDDRWAREDRIR